MRPEILFPLFAPLSSLPGLGPKMAPLAARVAGGERVLDLLFTLPGGLVDRRLRPLAAARPGAVATALVEVAGHRSPASSRAPWRITCRDGPAFIDILYFGGREDWISRRFPIGARRIVSGKVEIRDARLQMPHPDHVLAEAEAAELPALEPVYPLTAGLLARVMLRATRAALARAPDLPEWISAERLARAGWPSWREALRILHAPDPGEPGALAERARARLAFDEALAGQYRFLAIRARMQARTAPALAGDGRLREAALREFGHALTRGQQAALAEIDRDLARSQRMRRLLQGDVGSGKTLLASLAMLRAAESGHQAALMAPTELLARQHFSVIGRLAAAAGVEVALLTGRDRGRAREHLLAAIAAGTTRLVIGTHALLSADVTFQSLGLAVIDEGHRFGVHQRLGGAEDGTAPHVLVMTATPIPRTLLLTQWGEVDVSRIPDKPPGRAPVTTTMLALSELDRVLARLDAAVAEGKKFFWVCPLVGEKDSEGEAAAERRFAELSARLPGKVALLHGRMKPDARDAAMASFAAGRVVVLVATTVIEVGVDVPDAQVMVIEGAERFGLAQLHQLRGRVGRGDLHGACLLLHAADAPEPALSRLRVLCETDDGFRIAEADFSLRGPGEVLGTRQSGAMGLRLLEPALHGHLLAEARAEAEAAPPTAARALLLELFAETE
ncbi:MAG: ATP-dependent DNA helicase RecG [Acetobacteraceae bacterium]|nr:ATP-dependent DNA helicase RecG [Acetobacteraceae bacterium]